MVAPEEPVGPHGETWEGGDYSEINDLATKKNSNVYEKQQMMSIAEDRYTMDEETGLITKFVSTLLSHEKLPSGHVYKPSTFKW